MLNLVVQIVVYCSKKYIEIKTRIYKVLRCFHQRSQEPTCAPLFLPPLLHLLLPLPIPPLPLPRPAL